MRIISFISLFLFSFPAWSQHAVITGNVVNQQNQPVEGVNIKVESTSAGTSTDFDGKFQMLLPPGQTKITFLHLNYQPQTINLELSPNETKHLQIKLEEQVKTLDQIEILGEHEIRIRSQAGMIKIKPQSVKSLPTPFGEFNKILSTLPGVVGQNEFSSAYMVRGGNFDENLVYVNSIPIYRPFLVRSGQQEGLSFVNPDLVGSVEFSSGGWQPRYGDKLSSSLNITYKKPVGFDASLTAGLLGGTAHVEGSDKTENFRYLIGVRHKQWKYLLNTLETEGEYQPNFTDVQAYFNIDLSGGRKTNKKSHSEIDLLMSYAHNNYDVQPQSRETNIGNIFTEILRLYVGFVGKEVLEYDTYQAGAKFIHRFNENIRNTLIVSGLHTREREYYDIEGGYRLCDVDKRPGSETFDQCLTLRGIGTNYNHGRNRLEANVINVENQLSVGMGSTGILELGVAANQTTIDDYLQEFSFIDSADYVSIEESVISTNKLTYQQLSGFVQNTQHFGPHIFTYGVRYHYHTLNRQFLLSPRLQYAFQPTWTRDWVFRFATGLYRQPPFYREFRNMEGDLNTKIQAQSSFHISSGVDHQFQIWNRDFKFIGEAYYKYLYDVIPYDVDNVRIRYFAENMAKAYAWGIDMRISGEFIPGTESWLSAGFLNTKEDLDHDGQGYIRRPTDQRLTVSMLFEDHFPNDPTMRVNLNLQFGTGLPFGPPGNPDYRNALQGDYYSRVDIGFLKMLTRQKERNPDKLHKDIWLGVEVLNLLANENTVSYSWIKDFNNRQFGVPNSLSSRFINVKLVVR